MRCAALLAALPALAATVAAAASQRPFAAANADEGRVRFGVSGSEGAGAGMSASPNAPFDDILRIELPAHVAAESQGETQPRRSISDIVAEQNGKHVALSHPDFPQVSVRIRQMGQKTRSVSEMRQAPDASPLMYDDSDENAFCDPTVTSWSGYVDTVDGKSLFFYFFESRDNPSKDPVLLWLTGGPGCSSAVGLFMELGPCLIPENGGKTRAGPPINGTVWNPFSWNSHASIFFLDQPVDVGYSYSRYGLHTYDADRGAKDVYAFLRIFFAAFNKFQKNDFVITGESYAGRYIPRYASEVVDRNQQLVFAAERNDKAVDKSQLINLKKVAIGNGLTDVAVQLPMYYDFMCTRMGGVDPVLSIETCKRLVTWKERCSRWLHKECRETFDPDQCSAASDVCESQMSDAYMSTGRNPYNVQDHCRAGLVPNLCYNVMADIRTYLDRDDVRRLVGAEPVSKIGEFASCNNDVGRGFSKTHDSLVNNADYVAGLLERHVDVMIYVGVLDWICGHLGNKAWVQQFAWTEREAFHENKLRKWVVDGKEAGTTQRGGGLTWATVNGAGHMVPYDQPKVALALIDRFLNGEKL